MLTNQTTLDTLIGEVLTYVDTNDKNDVIMLTTASGRIIKIYHEQDCCEIVQIVDMEGKWHDLIGKVIVETRHESVEDRDPPEPTNGSQTHTTLTFKADDATVISRWIGDSNGYYSESVDIAELVGGRE